MYSPQEPYSPSPSTPSSGSPPPDEAPPPAIPNVPSGLSQRDVGTPKRRLPSGSAVNRDMKSRRRDDGGGVMRTFTQSDINPREGSRRDELLDTELMEKLKQELGDPFQEPEIGQIQNAA